MIIGLVGFIGSGKGTVGDILVEKGFRKDSFASPLKDACSIIFGWPRQMLEGDTEISRAWREKEDVYWSEKFGHKFTPRLALQLMGTEAGRDVFHPDIWVISLLNRSKGKNVVVTDVRFKNEIEHIQKNNGIIIRVKRGKDPEWYDLALKANSGDQIAIAEFALAGIHRSETDWIGCDFDYVIENDGTVYDLGNKVEDVLQRIM